MKDTSILGVKTWRLQKGLSLETIAASTKLSVSQLEAIEMGDFRKLPGAIYNTSYIKQYARAIGFDETELLAFYQGVCAPASTLPTEQNRPPSRMSRLLFQH
jgi:cytoskeleton protein RodZ